MLFDPPDVQLAKFTRKHCKRKTIATIPLGELESWKKLTQKTAGLYIAKYMAPSAADRHGFDIVALFPLRPAITRRKLRPHEEDPGSKFATCQPGDLPGGLPRGKLAVELAFRLQHKTAAP